LFASNEGRTRDLFLPYTKDFPEEKATPAFVFKREQAKKEI